MDFSGYCLYGIWACAVIRSKLFLDRRWAIGCGLIGDFLVLHRFLTVVYLLGVCAGFAGVCVAGGVAGTLFRQVRKFWHEAGDVSRRDVPAPSYFPAWRVPGLARKHLIAGALLPGIAVTVLICGYTLQHWPKGQLYHGATSLIHMGLSVLEPSLYEPNPLLINPLVMSAFWLIRWLLPIVFLLLIVTQFVLAVLCRAALPILLCAMLLAIITVHWLAFSNGKKQKNRVYEV